MDDLNDNTEISNEELLLLYRETGEERYVNQLYSQIAKLVTYTCEKYGKGLASFCNFTFEDLVSIANVGVAKAIKEYDFDKNVKFSTPVCKFIIFEFKKTFRYYRKLKKDAYLDSIMYNLSARKGEEQLVSITDQIMDTSVNLEEDVINTLCKIEDVKKLQEALDALPEKSRLIIRESFFKNKTNGEIAKSISNATNSVSRTKIRTLKVLKKMLEDPEYITQYKEKESVSSQYYGSVKDIPKDYREYFYLFNDKQQKALILRMENKMILKDIGVEIGMQEHSVASLLQSAALKIKRAKENNKVILKPSLYYAKLYEEHKADISDLKEKYQVILKLKYEDHKKYSEISEILKQPVSRICSSVRIAEDNFKRILIKKGKISQEEN